MEKVCSLRLVYFGVKLTANFLFEIVEMPALCDVCGKEFSTKSGLKKHKERKNPCKAPVQLLSTTVHQALVEAGVSHLEVPVSEFRETSKGFNQSLTKKERLEQGIFFTPKKARTHLFTTLSDLGVSPHVVLEPSFGSGEFVLDAKRIYPHAQIVGVEKNKELFDSLICPDTQLTCGDFLDWTGKADLIIGNPPYFVIPSDAPNKKELSKKYKNAVNGRINIYVLFLYKCLTEHLEKGGFLAFIIPTSLYNCSYYQPMRDYIQANTTIRHLETLDKPGFYETGQETMLLILENTKRNDDYLFRSKCGAIYLSPYYRELHALTQNTTSLAELGLGAKTGTVVWNNVKENLSDTAGTLLVYSSNIVNCELKVDNMRGKEKKQYVTDLTKPTLSGPVILFERGYGNSLRFNFVLVELQGFYAENHVNVIYPKTPEAAANLGRVVKSFQDERTLQFIKWFIGNGSISSTDLEENICIF